MINIEEVSALFKADAIVMPAYKLYQLNWNGRRYYYKIDETKAGSDVTFYDGVTSVIKAAIPEGDALVNWRMNLGQKEADRIMNEKALYGSLMHTVFTRLLIDKKFDLDQLDEVVKMYCEKNNQVLMPDWADDLRHDLTAFAQWLIDYDVKPLIIESPLVDNELYLGGTLDLLCGLTIEVKGFYGEVYKTGANAGQPKETKQAKRLLAIVDYKSNRSGSFYLSHQLQLGIYERMVKQNFAQFKDKDIALYNWSPKDWKTAPGYNFTQQTGKHSEEIYHAIRIMYDLLQPDISSRNLVYCEGMIDMESTSPIENIVKQINISEYVTRKNHKEKPVRTEDKPADSGLLEDRGEEPAGDSALTGLL